MTRRPPQIRLRAPGRPRPGISLIGDRKIQPEAATQPNSTHLSPTLNEEPSPPCRLWPRHRKSPAGTPAPSASRAKVLKCPKPPGARLFRRSEVSTALQSSQASRVPAATSRSTKSTSAPTGRARKPPTGQYTSARMPRFAPCTWPVPLAPRLGAIEPIVETLGRHRMLSPVHRPRSHDGIKGPCVGSDQVGQPRPRHHTVSVGGSQPDRRVSDRSGREPRCPSSSRVAAGNQQHSDPFTDDSLGAIGTGIQRYQRRQRQLHRIRGRSNAGQTCRQPVGLRRALE